MTKSFILILFLLGVIEYCQCLDLAPGAACTEDSECPRFYLCQGTTKKVCTHKPLLPSSSPLELGGAFISLLINALATAAGAGIGSFLVPYLTLINNFTPNSAIVISYAIVMAGGVATLANVRIKKNPATHRPFICYNILMLCVPPLLAGVPVGVLLNRMFAPVVVYILVFCLLIFFTVKNGKKLWRIVKNERKARKKSPSDNKPAVIEIETKVNHTTPTKVSSSVEEKVVTTQDAATTEKETSQQNIPQSKSDTQSTLDEKDSIQPAQDKHLDKEEEKDNSDQQQQVMGPKLESAEATGSTQNYLPKHEGDEHQADEEDELYQFQFNNILSLMLVDDPQKVAEEAREREQKELLERMKHSEEAGKAQDIEAKPSGTNEATMPNNAAHVLEKHKILFKREFHGFPLQKVWVPVASLTIVVVMNLIIGNAKSKSIADVSYCSSTYWGLYALMICMQVALFLIALALQLKWQKHKDQHGWEYLPEDIRLTFRRVVTIFCVVFIAGILAGVVAIGGATVIAPLMLWYGVPPQPLAATTAIIICCSQFSAFFTIAISRSYHPTELVFLLLIAAGISYPFSRAIKWFVKKTKRQSTALAIFMVVISISFVTSITSIGVSLRTDRTFLTTFNSHC